MPRTTTLLLVCAVLALVSCGAPRSQPPLEGHASHAAAVPVAPWLRPYQPVAKRILRHTRPGRQAWDKLLVICDDIGPRLAGSPAGQRAIDWAQATLRREGFQGVRAEPVTIPRWERGAESLHLVSPRRAPISMLGLGFSVGTPPGGITAPVVVVRSEAQLKALGESVRGKIVLFNHVMPPYDPVRGTGYGAAARYRVKGASMAARQGAAAVLVRSVTARSLRTPHTGMMRYAEGVPKIPAAAISTEDASLLARFQARGIVPRVTLVMGARNLGTTTSANVIAELRGRQRPGELVVIGCHLDSWDVGTGAHDDGAGCAMAMGAMTVLRQLGLRPRRTVRLVLWTAEELNLYGAKEYARAHAAELPRHVAAIEADAGGYRFTQVGYDLDKSAPESLIRHRLSNILRLLAPLGEKTVRKGWSGADLIPLRGKNILLLGLLTDIRRYFDVHHSPADTVDKIDRRHLQDATAALAVLAYVLADLPERLLPPKPPRGPR